MSAFLSLTLGAAAAAIAGIFLANSDVWLSDAQRATLEYLENAELKTVGDDEKTFKAKTLWANSGAIIWAEAAGLSSLKPQLDELGVPLYAVVKESVGAEIRDLGERFAGEIFLDEERVFYGPLPRKMGLLGLFRLGVWLNFFRAWQAGHHGNLKGEGFILGGVFVVGAGDQGILLEHREKEFGNIVGGQEVLEAAKKIRKTG